MEEEQVRGGRRRVEIEGRKVEERERVGECRVERVES